MAARSEIIETLSKIIVQHPVNYWVTEFKKSGVPCTPILTVSQAFSDAQAVARDALWDLDGQNSVANALRFMSKTPAESTKRPPKLGEHTAESLPIGWVMGDELVGVANDGRYRDCLFCPIFFAFVRRGRIGSTAHLTI